MPALSFTKCTSSGIDLAKVRRCLTSSATATVYDAPRRMAGPLWEGRLRRTRLHLLHLARKDIQPVQKGFDRRQDTVERPLIGDVCSVRSGASSVRDNQELILFL